MQYKEIAEQLLMDNLDKPMVIPETHSGGRAKEFEIDGKLIQLKLYNFNYRKKGYAQGLYLLCDRIKNNLQQGILAIKLV